MVGINYYLCTTSELPAIAFRQHSLILAGHFSLHFSTRFSFAEAFEPLTSATTALVFDDTSSSVADLLLACLAIGPGMLSPNGLDEALVDVDPVVLDLLN